MEDGEETIDLKLLTPSLRTTHNINKIPLIKSDTYDVSCLVMLLIIALIVLFIFYRQIFDHVPCSRNTQSTSVCII